MKRMISTFLCIIMIFCMVPFSSAAAGDGTITVDTVVAARGDTVAVNLVYTGNPGIAAVSTTVTYDASMLTYERNQRGIIFGDEFPTVGKHPEKNYLRVVFSNVYDSTINGTMVTLFFTVKEEARAGTHKITIEYAAGDFCNWETKKLAPKIVAGGVTITTCKHPEFGKWKTALKPTCTAEGYDERACVDCGYLQTRDTEALGHDFADVWKVDEIATKESSGSMSRHCSRCDAITDILNFSLEEAEENHIDNKEDAVVPPSDFTGPLPEKNTGSSSSSPSSDNSDSSQNSSRAETFLTRRMILAPKHFRRPKAPFFQSFTIIYLSGMTARCFIP